MFPPPNDAATTPQNGVTDSPSTHGVTDSPSTLLARSPGKGPGPPQALPPQQSIVCVWAPRLAAGGRSRGGRPAGLRAPGRSENTFWKYELAQTNIAPFCLPPPAPPRTVRGGSPASTPRGWERPPPPLPRFDADRAAAGRADPPTRCSHEAASFQKRHCLPAPRALTGVLRGPT